CQEENTWPTF
nr:immunoglobulin light chain junction region [Macaca mulatta]MOV62645.1 immunoglobulin light chain junction region [Macaca mulatta]MOV64187.1 immunoglobulin light chain junction region [Macaca mulatta]